MSQHRARALTLLLAALSAAGCVVPDSLDGYCEDRRQDLIDVAHIDLSALSAGAVVYAGPLLFGANHITPKDRPGQDTTLQCGLGGPRFVPRQGLAAGFIWPVAWWNEDRHIVGLRPKQTPSPAAFGVALGAAVGIGVEADAFELVDFLLGLFCIDLAEDDAHIAGLTPPPPEPPPPSE